MIKILNKKYSDLIIELHKRAIFIIWDKLKRNILLKKSGSLL